MATIIGFKDFTYRGVMTDLPKNFVKFFDRAEVKR